MTATVGNMGNEKQPAVYIMANRYRGTIYTGVTSDLGTRVQTHKANGFKGFSSKYKTHILVWYEHHEDMASAIARETKIKNWRRNWKHNLIESINPDWHNLQDDIFHRPVVATPEIRIQTYAVTSGMTHVGTTLSEGVTYYAAYFSPEDQQSILATLRAAVAQAPLFTPEMPKTGKPFSVRMTNLGSLGWVSDKARGYRYQPTHPTTNKPWPAMPNMLTKLWQDVAHYPHPAEACLVNFYTTSAKMGLHQDRDEQAFEAPVVSISLGDTALFRWGGTTRGGKTQSVKLQSGDVFVFGGPARLCYHGIDRVYPGTSTLLKDDGRINLTMRRVTKPIP
jgi:DNA oxidative demethylase